MYYTLVDKIHETRGKEKKWENFHQNKGEVVSVPLIYHLIIINYICPLQNLRIRARSKATKLSSLAFFFVQNR